MEPANQVYDQPVTLKVLRERDLSEQNLFDAGVSSIRSR